MRATAWLLSAAILLSGCGTDDASQSPIPSRPYGDPIEAGPMPGAAACQGRLRSDVGAAVRIRTVLAVAGVPATEVAARTAAADPTSETTTLGIPLTADELGAIRAGGFAFDPWSPLSYWVATGAPERFGGMWLEGATIVVTVVNGDPASLALARCIEVPPTKYLWADVSQAEGRALQERIGTDMQALRAAGIAVNMTYYDVKTGLVNVGVTTPTPEVRAFFEERYGTRVVVIQEGPVELL